MTSNVKPYFTNFTNHIPVVYVKFSQAVYLPISVYVSANPNKIYSTRYGSGHRDAPNNALMQCVIHMAAGWTYWYHAVVLFAVHCHWLCSALFLQWHFLPGVFILLHGDTLSRTPDKTDLVNIFPTSDEIAKINSTFHAGKDWWYPPGRPTLQQSCAPGNANLTFDTSPTSDSRSARQAVSNGSWTSDSVRCLATKTSADRFYHCGDGGQPFSTVQGDCAVIFDPRYSGQLSANLCCRCFRYASRELFARFSWLTTCMRHSTSPDQAGTVYTCDPISPYLLLTLPTLMCWIQ